MPAWLKALEQTTLRFWADKEPLSWGQAMILLPVTGGVYNFARLQFAGGAPWLSSTALLVTLQLVIALVALISGGRFGQISVVAPKLLRLIFLHLILAMLIVGTNNFFQWARRIDLWFVCLLASVVASGLFLIYTLNRSSDSFISVPSRDWGVYLSGLLVALLNTVILYRFILPAQ